MESILCKIIDQFEYQIDLYIRSYIEHSSDFAKHSAEEKEADAFQLFEMITDHPEFRSWMETWATAMHETYLEHGMLSCIDDDSLSENAYIDCIDWAVVNEFITAF